VITKQALSGNDSRWDALSDFEDRRRPFTQVRLERRVAHPHQLAIFGIAQHNLSSLTHLLLPLF
jgi:hypothetical protein